METICVPSHTYPFYCSPAGSMWGCLSLFIHGGMDWLYQVAKFHIMLLGVCCTYCLFNAITVIRA